MDAVHAAHDDIPSDFEKRPAIGSHISSLGIGVKAFSLVSAIRVLGTSDQMCIASRMKNLRNTGKGSFFSNDRVLQNKIARIRQPRVYVDVISR